MAADLKGETLLAGLAARLRDDHAGQFALQGGQHVGRSLVRNRVTRNLRHGTRKIHLFLDAVADDDHLAHLRRLFLQRNVHRSTSLDGDALLLIAHKRDVEDGPFGNIECKLALVIGGHSLTAALHSNILAIPLGKRSQEIDTTNQAYIDMLHIINVLVLQPIGQITAITVVESTTDLAKSL